MQSFVFLFYFLLLPNLILNIRKKFCSFRDFSEFIISGAKVLAEKQISEAKVIAEEKCVLQWGEIKNPNLEILSVSKCAIWRKTKSKCVHLIPYCTLKNKPSMAYEMQLCVNAYLYLLHIIICNAYYSSLCNYLEPKAHPPYAIPYPITTYTICIYPPYAINSILC